MTDGKTATQKVYGKGFVDGLKAAQEGGVSIGVSRAKELEQALSGVERKVYENLSIQSEMTAGEVVGQIKRTTGSAADVRIVGGCLESLVERGLARRASYGKFQREPVKDRAAPAKLEVVKATPVAEKASEKIMESNVEAIRRISGEIVERLDLIEGRAKALEQERDSAKERNEKANRLAELLKEFK